ncbi:universal stress protein [Maricurvus nonylphenolicus]|uniref:universal stress protein n=1 Tax=Maricurvus nonylphenolicus TaxID=1008307 RepID=UPI0036F1E1AA
MAKYQHILVALDLSEESDQVLQQAIELATNSGAKLSLAHVIEPLTFAYGGDIPVDLTEVQEQLQVQAQEQLDKIVSNITIGTHNQHVVIGQPAAEIHRLAEEEDCDLVVVGSHGRRGLALLLGSTANGVLHGAKCDVLAVRVSLPE